MSFLKTVHGLSIDAGGGETPNLIIRGDGEQTFRFHNTNKTGTTKVSWKMANRLNSDWSWIWLTDSSNNGTNDLSVQNMAGLLTRFGQSDYAPTIFIRRPGLGNATIINAVGNGTTITYTANNQYAPGERVTITGVSPSAYNLTNVVIASSNSAQFTVTNVATGTYVSGGTVAYHIRGNTIQAQNSAGTNMFVVYPTGGVLINDTDSSNFSNSLEIRRNASNTSNYFSGSRISIKNENSTVNNFSTIAFNTSGGNDAAAIWTIYNSHTASAATGQLVFGTANASGSAVERMRITNTGSVGIGVSTPLERLHVSDNVILDSGGSGNRITKTNIIGSGDSGTTGNFRSSINFIPTGSNGFSTAITFNNLASDFFNSSMTERMRITSGGNVGIGTASPSTPLNVYSANTSGFTGITVQNNNVGTGIAGIEFGSDVTYKKAAIGLLRNLPNGGGAMTFYLDINTDAANWDTSDEKMRIAQNGNVGIGTSAPGSLLDVNGVITGGQFTSTRANSTITGGGQVYLNGATGNRIDFNVNGVNAPTLTTRSVGTKIVLFPSLTASSVDYAIGVQGGAMWFSVPDSNSKQYLWYGGTTAVASLSSAGAFTAVTKSFDIEHPTKEGMRLRYGSLEGPENGVYVRGKSDSSIITLPDYWTGLVDEDTITVQLTPKGSNQNLYVEDIMDNTVKIGGVEGEFFYFIQAERKDVDKSVVEY
jgi:hypothetical protein